jgi:glyoxylase-like metal-dependent hydrolase (beta-lactamase superfamily II)
MFRKILKWFGIVILLIAVTGVTLFMIYVRPFMQKMKQTSTIKYDKELTLEMGGGGNSGILVSDSLVIVIDTKMDDAAEQLAKTVKELAGNKPILVINTHFHPDHTKGNILYKGQRIIAGGNYTKESWAKEASKEVLPTDWLKDRLDIKMGTDTLTILNMAKNIHTESDIVVYLHQRKMLFAGDIILNKQAPALFGKADPDGYFAAFDQLTGQFNIQKVVPGHGDVGGPEVIENFRQFFLDMKTAANDPSKKDELITKYKDWNQLPLVMSPGATVRAIQKKEGK